MPLQVQEYTTLRIPKIGSSGISNIQEFQKNIALQGQGRAVIIQNDAPVYETLLAFSVLYDTARTISVLCDDSALVLLLDRTVHDVVFDEEHTTRVVHQIDDLHAKRGTILNMVAPLRLQKVNLSSLWISLVQKKDIVADTIAFLQYVDDSHICALTLEICGKIPVVPLLAFFVYIRRYGERITYCTDEDEVVTIFSSFQT